MQSCSSSAMSNVALPDRAEELRLRLFAFLALSAVECMLAAHAEGGCPPGQYPQQGQGWKTCVPIPGANDTREPAQPIVKWQSKSGAIAADGQKGVLGTAEDEPSEAEAIKKAMTSCRANGGEACKVRDSYSNGCAVMTVGTKGFAVGGGSTLKDATSNSMSKCASDGDTGCHVYYSGCSFPSREG